MIQSVDRAARIMKALSAGSRGLGVSELAVSLGLAKTTVHGLLRTLQEHGLVEQNAESGKYQLGPALLELSSGYLDLSELRARSFAWAELLALRTGEAVRVGVLHDNAILGRARIAAPNSDRRDLVTGAAGPREQLVAPEPGERIVSFVIEVARSVSRDLAATRWPPR